MASTETASAERSAWIDQLVQKINERSIREVAERKGRIADIGERNTRAIDTLFRGGEDGASLHVRPMHDEVRDAAQKQQDARMHAIDNDAQAKVEQLDDGVGGYFDGKLVIGQATLVHGGTDEVRRTHLHEAQHKEDETHQRGNIDDALLTPTGITQIDDQLPTTTGRDVFERRAMQAEGGSLRGPYVEQHWKPALQLEEAFERAGVDGKEAVRAYAENDAPAFQKAKSAVLLYYLLHSSSQN